MARLRIARHRPRSGHLVSWLQARQPLAGRQAAQARLLVALGLATLAAGSGRGTRPGASGAWQWRALDATPEPELPVELEPWFALAAEPSGVPGPAAEATSRTPDTGADLLGADALIASGGAEPIPAAQANQTAQPATFGREPFVKPESLPVPVVDATAPAAAPASIPTVPAHDERAVSAGVAEDQERPRPSQQDSPVAESVASSIAAEPSSAEPPRTESGRPLDAGSGEPTPFVATSERQPPDTPSLVHDQPALESMPIAEPMTAPDSPSGLERRVPASAADTRSPVHPGGGESSAVPTPVQPSRQVEPQVIGAGPGEVIGPEPEPVDVAEQQPVAHPRPAPGPAPTHLAQSPIAAAPRSEGEEVFPPRRRLIEEFTAPTAAAPPMEPSSEGQTTDSTSHLEQPSEDQTTAEAEAPRPLTAADLFLPSEADRSPAAWLARLTTEARRTAEGQPAMALESPPVAAGQQGAARFTEPDETVVPAGLGPQPTPATPVAPRSMPPTPLPESTRRFLRPIIGIDPAAVPVHRGPQAEQVASSYRADAVTLGGEVFVAGHVEGHEPEALGVLAHELTHVAQRREPRFVPPVVGQRAGSLPEAVPLVPVGSELERAAGRAESAAVQAALTERRQAIVARPAYRSVAPDSLAMPSRPSEPARSPASAVPASHQGESPDEVASEWGGLPLPWEPLPDWLAPEAESSGWSQPAQPTTTAPVSSALPVATGNGLPASSAALPAVAFAADPSRPEPADSTEAQAPRSQPTGNVEPDLDALARQVYAVLKRRLAADQRRMG